MGCQKLMSNTCFSLEMPKFCSTFVYYVAEMSEGEYLHCVQHVLRLCKTYLMLPELIIGSEKKRLGGDT